MNNNHSAVLLSIACAMGLCNGCKTLSPVAGSVHSKRAKPVTIRLRTAELSPELLNNIRSSIVLIRNSGGPDPISWRSGFVFGDGHRIMTSRQAVIAMDGRTRSCEVITNFGSSNQATWIVPVKDISFTTEVLQRGKLVKARDVALLSMPNSFTEKPLELTESEEFTRVSRAFAIGFQKAANQKFSLDPTPITGVKLIGGGTLSVSVVREYSAEQCGGPIINGIGKVLAIAQVPAGRNGRDVYCSPFRL